MSADYKPGAVGLSAFGRVFNTDHGWVFEDDSGYPAADEIKGFRPLVVIDPEDRGQVERLIGAVHHVDPDGIEPHDIDEMQAALREFANPTPPKPEEPTGLGAVVEDADGAKWILVYDEMGDVRLWAPLGAVATQTKWREWAEINVARVLSEGMPS